MARRPIETSETPLEFARRAFPRPTSRAHAMVITELYLKERYGGAERRRDDAQLARRAWRALHLDRWMPWSRQ